MRRPLHYSRLQRAQILFWGSLSQNLGLNLSGALIHFDDVFRGRVVNLQVKGCFLYRDTLFLNRPY